MSALIHSKGRQGLSSVDGSDGLSVADVSGGKILNPMFDVFGKNELERSGNLTWTRTGNALHENISGNFNWINSNDVTNYITDSEDFTAWGDPFSAWTRIGTTTDPDGGSNATEINLDSNIGSGFGLMLILLAGIPQGGNLTISFWIKVISGTVTGIESIIGTDIYDMGTPTSSWQKVTKTVNSIPTSGNFYLNPIGETGARIAITRVQLVDNLQDVDYIQTTGSTVTVPFDTNTVLGREGSDGWLIEESKSNTCLYSGDLSKWTISSGTVANLATVDPFGITDEPISLLWGSFKEITLQVGIDGVTLPLLTYSISFYANVSQGSLDSLTAELDNGLTLDMGTPSTDGFVRLTVTSDPALTIPTSLTITAKSSAKNAVLNISGVQVEAGYPTSYIKTGTQKQTRGADLVTADAIKDFPKANGNWTLVVAPDGSNVGLDERTLFETSAASGSKISCFLQGGQMILQAGTSFAVNSSALTGSKFAFVKSSGAITVYAETERLNFLIVAIIDSEFADTLHLGSNSSGLEYLNGSIAGLNFFDYALNQNEIKYLMGR